MDKLDYELIYKIDPSLTKIVEARRLITKAEKELENSIKSYQEKVALFFRGS